jgi:cystathionine beta-lyase
VSGTDSYRFDEPLERRGTYSIKWDLKPDLLPFWIADMDFPAPPPVSRTIRERADHPVYGYTMMPSGARDAFTAWLERRHGYLVRETSLVYVPGVMAGVRLAIYALTRPGDGVVIQSPVYFPFFSCVEQLGRRLRVNRLLESELSYEMDLAGLEAIIADGASMLLLCSPHNPIGRVWTETELRSLAEICRRRGVIVVSDEIHADLIMPGQSFVPFGPIAEELGCRHIVLQSPSKSFNIAGLLSAFMIAPDRDVRAPLSEGSVALSMNHPNLFSAIAMESAYRDCEDWLDHLLPYLSENFSFLCEYLAEHEPRIRVFRLEGTYLAWLDMREFGLSDGELKARLQRDAGLWLHEGEQFGPGGAGFQRLNFACPRSLLERGLERLVSLTASMPTRA